MNALVSIHAIYYLIGLVVMILVGLTLRDKAHPKRYTTALFWFLFGSTFLFGDLSTKLLGDKATHLIVGVFIIIMALLAGFKQISMGTYSERSDAEKQQTAAKIGYKIFIPALVIPIVTVICTLAFKGVSIGGIYILDQNKLTLAALTVACLMALLAGYLITRGTPLQAVRESRRLVDSIGWAAVLPQMLAMLGGVFVVANSGDAIKLVIEQLVSPDSRLGLVVVYCVGMAGFTMIMGNAFAAFPVMTAGVAMPFLITMHGANPAIVVSIGMYAGYCGTLMTPMGANFNIVPAALLNLADRYQVIKVQIPTAVMLLFANIVLMYFLAFHF